MQSVTTLPELFLARIDASASQDAVHLRQESGFVPRRWEELADDVFALAARLVDLGVQPGDRVAQFAENRYEWLVVDLAIQMSRAVHVPIHAPLTGEQAAYQIDHSGADVVFVSTPAQSEKLTKLARPWKPTLRIYAFEPCAGTLGELPILPWQELLEEVSETEVEKLKRSADEVRADALATILYTSGTTGEPKGVMLTQRNLVSNAIAAVNRFGMTGSDRRLTFLPLSHIFARTCDMYTWLVTGSQLALAQSRESVLADCAAFRPSIMNGVPYFYDKVRRVLEDLGRANDPGSLRALLGGEIHYCCSGGAALPLHVFDFFWEREVPLLQGYGLTETSPVISMSTISQVRRGASGRAVEHVEVKVAEDGEIFTKGPHVMVGYYGRPEATAEVLHDGWFSTGDYGHIDDDGFIFVTGRKKELIVTTGGKNIAPVQLESLLTEDPLILQAVIVGDDQDYLTALVVPDPEALKAELAARNIAIDSPENLLADPRVTALFEKCICERLKGLSYYEQVRKFRLMPRGFTIESGELTPKLSLRRQAIHLNCRDVIAEMYRKEGSGGRTS